MYVLTFICNVLFCIPRERILEQALQITLIQHLLHSFNVCCAGHFSLGLPAVDIALVAWIIEQRKDMPFPALL